MKKAYAEELAGNGEISKAEKIMESSETDPIFSGFTIHPEQEPNTSDINKSFRDIAIDIYALNKEIQAAAQNFNQLMLNINLQLDAADEMLQIEEDRIKDMNVICGNYQEFTMVKTLKTTSLARLAMMAIPYSHARPTKRKRLIYPYSR